MAETQYGSIKGTRIQSRDGRDIFAYYGIKRGGGFTFSQHFFSLKGIPFAKPPLRFARPEPLDVPEKPKPYSGKAKDLFHDGSRGSAPECAQKHDVFPPKWMVKGVEDCLTLSVYVPDGGKGDLK